MALEAAWGKQLGGMGSGDRFRCRNSVLFGGSDYPVWNPIFDVGTSEREKGSTCVLKMKLEYGILLFSILKKKRKKEKSSSE
jgi:hypothetical protein